jgi:transcriptional regulator with XRE-family HTH domain
MMFSTRHRCAMEEALPGDGNNRRELGRFLRSRRERVTPHEVGFPVGPRRRTQGLRREEVAVLAGVSPTWYTYLEQGRDIHPSPEVLDSLARVLRLTEDERRYMHTLIYGQPIQPQQLDVEVTAEELLKNVIDAICNGPHPAYSVDHRSDLIAWNAAAVEWYDDWGRLPAGERNMMRWMLIAPRAKERLVDWVDDTRDAVARWRVQTAKWPTDKLIQERIAEFHGISPDFTRWWNEQDVGEHRSRVRRFRHPQYGSRSMRLAIMQAPEFMEAYIVFHLPV